jgi:hypothetical protein
MKRTNLCLKEIGEDIDFCRGIAAGKKLRASDYGSFYIPRFGKSMEER